METSFDVYGIRIQVSTKATEYSDILNDLTEDFLYFHLTNSGLTPDVSIEISPFLSKPAVKRGRFLFQNKAAKVFGWGKQSLIEYGEEAIVIVTQATSKKPRLLQIFCSDRDEAYELAHLSILSCLGEEMDKRGFHRVHALGIQKNEQSAIVVLRSGGGKSSIATLLSKDSHFKIFSDETPFISGNSVHAFPVRMALRREVAVYLGLSENVRAFKRKLYTEKLLYPIPPDQIATKSLPIRFTIIEGVNNRDSASIIACSKFMVFFALLESMVVGVGVAQIGELLLRPNRAFSLLLTGFSRLLTAARVAIQTEAYLFNLSREARENVEALEKFFTLHTENKDS